jgi:hypothetical protein
LEESGNGMLNIIVDIREDGSVDVTWMTVAEDWQVL